MELAHANRVATMGQLTASIVHEVNQPITATMTNAQAPLRFLDAQVVDLASVENSEMRGQLSGAQTLFIAPVWHRRPSGGRANRI